MYLTRKLQEPRTSKSMYTYLLVQLPRPAPIGRSERSLGEEEEGGGTFHSFSGDSLLAVLGLLPR